ncbi:hypothetical protein ACGFZS_47310 [Streptomyces sp. NPDC048288]|uniref:hypothetical protein n=1 Tax=Streptomyces sp. NPDC048288 TaxID=3365529 RepID=UPI003720A693
MRRSKQHDSQIVIDGAHGSTYAVGTVEQIDANLESLRHHRGHPDIDRLLDARLLVGSLRRSA